MGGRHFLAKTKKEEKGGVCTSQYKHTQISKQNTGKCGSSSVFNASLEKPLSLYVPYDTFSCNVKKQTTTKLGFLCFEVGYVHPLWTSAVIIKNIEDTFVVNLSFSLHVFSRAHLPNWPPKHSRIGSYRIFILWILFKLIFRLLLWYYRRI